LILSAAGLEFGTEDALNLIAYGSIALAATLVTWPVRRFIDRRTFASLGFRLDRHTLPDLLFGFALAGLMMGLIYAVESALGWLRFEGWAWQAVPTGQVIAGIAGAFALYVIVGYWEELLNRGYQLQNLADGLNLPLALILSSLFFAVYHLGNPGAGWQSFVGIFVAGLHLACGWVFTRQLWVPIGLHIGWNFFEGTIFGFLVSGTEGFHLIRQTVEGPVLLTGGAFGPEAGLVGWAVVGIGTVLIWAYGRGRNLTTSSQPDNATADR
jgi:membrane protease YdiL (CAAX protease family)